MVNGLYEIDPAGGESSEADIGGEVELRECDTNGAVCTAGNPIQSKSVLDSRVRQK
jgi:hypothetical protein